MNENLQKVAQKIRNLLARADRERNDNEHEREVALRQANALLAKYGLSAAEVSAGAGEGEAFGSPGMVSLDTHRGTWVATVYGSLARLNGCFVVREQRRAGDQTITIFGRAVRVTVTRQMAEYVVESIRREAEYQHKANHREIHGRRFKVDFGLGAAAGVNGQVERILAEQRRGRVGEEELSQSQAMVVTDQHKKAVVEAERLARDLFGPLRRSSYSRTNGSLNAQRAGYDYGSNVSLNSQVPGRGAQGRLGQG